MKVLTFAATSLWCLFSLNNPVCAQSQKSALVIGNSSYQFVPSLPNPLNDANDVAQALDYHGFRVMQVNNAKLGDMRQALVKFRNWADESDVALVFYAGHGIEIQGVNYLVPTNAQIQDVRDASIELLKVDDLLEQMNGASKMKLLVLDACRNNPFINTISRSGLSRSVGRGLTPSYSQEPDTFIAYAAAAGAVTPDGVPGSNSPFTAAFVSALSGPPVDVRLLFGRVRDRMRLSVPSASPYVYSSLGGDEYVINPRMNSELGLEEHDNNSISLPPEINFDFDTAERLDRLDIWEKFISKHTAHSDHKLYKLAINKMNLARVKNIKSADVDSKIVTNDNHRINEVLKTINVHVTQPQASTEEFDISNITSNINIKKSNTRPPKLNRPKRLASLSGGYDLPNIISASPERQEKLQPASFHNVAKLLQEQLKRRNCYFGKLDGIAGPKTIEGVKRVAQASGIEFQINANSPVDDVRIVVRKISNLNKNIKCKVTKNISKKNIGINQKAKNCFSFEGQKVCI